MAQANQRKKAATPTKARAKKAPKASAKVPAKATATRKLATATKKTAAPKTIAKRTKAASAKAVAKKTRGTSATRTRTTPTTKAAKGKAIRGKATTPAVTAKRKQPARRAKNVVLQVPPVVIDTTAAAAVAANLVLQHTPPTAPSPVPAHPTTQNALKRGSSAFRHVKESLSNPVSRQLAHVFGPAPLVGGLLPTAFRNDRSTGARKVTRTLNPHAGHFGVPRRAAG